MAIWSPEVNVDNVVLVDGSATTQPVSGSVAVSNFPATQPISGSVSVSNLPATQPVSGSVSVSNFPGVASTAAITRVATSASSVLLLSANASRKGFVLTTEAGSANYVALAATASVTAYTYLLGAATVLDKSGYTGPVSIIRGSGTGTVQITELL